MVANQVLPPPAVEGDPRLSVHTLGEFLYCPRAGLQAFEHQTDEFEDEPPVAHLNFQPPYELADLREQLHWQLQRALWLLGVLVVVVVTSVLLMSFDSRWFAVPGVLAGFLGLRMLGRQLPILWRLHRMQQQSLRAGRQSPRETLDAPERINWWALLNDGFDSAIYGRMVDVGSQLGGCPWRVLRRGALRIPVVRVRQEKDHLFDGHFAKVAAYCHLLRIAEPATLSPYGIVLFGDTYVGFAIPNDPHSRKHFHQALFRAREMIRDAERPEGEPHAPEQSERRKLCTGCHWGFPVVYRPGETESKRFGTNLTPRVVKAKDDRGYHSPCGDRFDWIPPHAKAVEKGLTIL